MRRHACRAEKHMHATSLHLFLRGASMLAFFSPFRPPPPLGHFPPGTTLFASLRLTRWRRSATQAWLLK